MKKISIISAIFMIFSCFLVFSACSSNEEVKPATVTIDTGLGQSKSALSKAPAPADVVSLTIYVEGPDMVPVAGAVILSDSDITVPNTDPDNTDLTDIPDLPDDGTTTEPDDVTVIPVDYDPVTGNLSLSVPSGLQREFMLMAVTEAETIYIGTATADILSGVMNTVTITMMNYNDLFPSAFVSVEVLIDGISLGDAMITQDYTATISIIGPDIMPITAIYLPYPYMYTVPAGIGRVFEVAVVAGPSMPGAGVMWQGIAIANLVEGMNDPVVINMQLVETKIVVPDYEYNQRIVQLEELSVNGWVDTQIGLGYSLYPYDIDYDNLGGIYIVNNGISTGDAFVYRIEDISSTSPAPIVNNSGLSGFTAIAIDRINSLLYYSSNTELFQNSIEGTAEVPLSFSAESITGLAVDDTGMLYIACNIVGVGPAVVKFDPVQDSQLLINNTDFNTPWDVVVKDIYVYVTNTDVAAPENNKVIQLNLDLNYVAEIRQNQGKTDQLNNPHRFVAILNSRFYITDESANSDAYDRIIAFDDMTGTNWEAFGATGTGLGGFLFYNYFYTVT